MKKIMSLALLASMILSASSFVFAEGVNKQGTTVVSEGTGTDDQGSDTTNLPWYSYQHLVKLVSNNQKMSAGIGITAAVVAMYNYCSWFRKLIGMEDEEDAKSPRLNPRLATATRAY